MAVTDEDLAKLIVQFSADFTRYRNETQKIIRATYGAADQVERRFTRMEGRVARVGDNIGRQFRLAIAALGTGFAVRDLGRLADAWTEQENALKSVAAAVDRPVSSMEQLSDVAIRTRSALSSTVTLYARTERAAENLGRSQAELRRFVELTNMAFVAGGATGTERRSSITQLAQGLASGQLMGEELRAIRENSPLVARAIADAMGVGIGALRDLGAEGKITSELVLDAVLAAGESIQAQFDATTATVGQSLENLRTRAARYIAELDDAADASQKLAGFIDYVSRNLDALSEAAVAAATAIGGVLAGRAMAAAIPAMITFAMATTGAGGALGRAAAASILASRGFAALRASMMFLVSNPIGITIMAIATAVGYLALESQSAASRADRLERALAVLGEATDDLGNSTAAAAAAQHALMESRRLDNLEIVRRSLIEQRRELERLERAYADAEARANSTRYTGGDARGLSEGQREALLARQASAAREEMAALSGQIRVTRESVDLLTAGFEDLSEETGRIASEMRQAINVTELAATANRNLDDVLETIVNTLGDAGRAQELLNEVRNAEAIDDATAALERQETALRQIEAGILAIRAAEMATAGIPISDELGGGGGFFALSTQARAEVDALEAEAERYREVIGLIQGFISALETGTQVGADADARRDREQALRREADAIRDRTLAQREFGRELERVANLAARGDFDAFSSLLADTARAQREAEDALSALEEQLQSGTITQARYNEELARAQANISMLRDQTERLQQVADQHQGAKHVREQAEAQERLNRLVAAQLNHELELARLRGNEDHIRALDREMRVRERIAELTEAQVSKEEARRIANTEADERETARVHGERRQVFASVFSDSLRAALSGDFTNVLSNAFGTAADAAFQRLGESIYDAIFDVPADIAKASAEGTAQGTAAAAPMSAAITTSGTAAATAMHSSIVSAGVAAGRAMAMSIQAAGSGGGGGKGGGLLNVGLALLSGGKKLPGKQDGGHIPPGRPVLVGEKRPEIFVPDSAGTVLPRIPEIVPAASSRPTDVRFHQTIDLTGANGEETIRRIAYQASVEGAQAAVRATEQRQSSRARMTRSGG